MSTFSSTMALECNPRYLDSIAYALYCEKIVGTVQYGMEIRLFNAYLA